MWMVACLVLQIAPLELQSGVPGEVWGLEGDPGRRALVACYPIFSFASLQDPFILDLLVPSATWQVIKAAMACSSHGLGLSPRPSVCLVIAGVKMRGWA